MASASAPAAAQTPFAIRRAKIVAALTQAGVEFVLANPRARRGYIDIELVSAPANVKKAEALLVAVETPQWAGIAASLLSGKVGSQSIGDLSMTLRESFKAASPKSGDPSDLIDAYTTEASQLQAWKRSITPETMPTGPALIALDPPGRVKAVVAACARLGKRDTPGWHSRTMLCALVAKFLRGKLPFTDADQEAMLLSCTTSELPYGLLADCDRLVVDLVGRRRGPPTKKMAAALEKIIAKRKRELAADRRVRDACANLLERSR